MRYREDDDAPPDHVVGSAEDLQTASVGQLAAPVADDEVSLQPSLEDPRGSNRRPSLRKSPRAGPHLDPPHDPLDDEPGPVPQVRIGYREESGRGRGRGDSEHRGEHETCPTGVSRGHSKKPVTSRMK
jgi:hypothetical protein